MLATTPMTSSWHKAMNLSEANAYHVSDCFISHYIKSKAEQLYMQHLTARSRLHTRREWVVDSSWLAEQVHVKFQCAVPHQRLAKMAKLHSRMWNRIDCFFLTWGWLGWGMILYDFTFFILERTILKFKTKLTDDTVASYIAFLNLFLWQPLSPLLRLPKNLAATQATLTLKTSNTCYVILP